MVVAVAVVVLVVAVVFCFGCRKCNAKCLLPPLQLFIMRMAMASECLCVGRCVA